MKKLIFFLFLIGQAYAQIPHYKVNQESTYQTKRIRLNKNYIMATHEYKNSSSQKLFITIHGYTEKCGYLKTVHEFLIENHYDVICLELPGHGGSSGERVNIDDFKTYSLMLADYDLKELRKKYKEINFLGHSTGAIPFFYVAKDRSNQFDKTILIAPLRRSNYWHTISILAPIANLFTDHIRRGNKPYPIYKKIKATDPSYPKYMSIPWYYKLKDWNKIEYKFQDKKPILMIQADNDKVIDADNSTEFYQKHFPKAHIQIIKGGTHHPYMQEGKIALQFFNSIKTYLKIPKSFEQ